MATGTLSGVNFKLEDSGIIEIFEARGTKIGGQWAINGFGGAVWVQVPPESIMPIVRDCIDSDIKAGHGDKIAVLLLGPRQAVNFFLEGKIARKHIENIVEGVDFIDFPDVDVDDRTLTVRVTGSPEFGIATADADGNIL